MKLVFLFMFALGLGLSVEAKERSKYVMVKRTKWLPLQYRQYLTVDEEKGGVNVLFGFYDHPQETFVLLHTSDNQKQEIYMEWNASSCINESSYRMWANDGFHVKIVLNPNNTFTLIEEGIIFGPFDNPLRFKINSSGYVDVFDKTGAALSSYAFKNQKAKTAVAKFFENLQHPVNNVNETNLPGLKFQDDDRQCNVTARIFLNTNNKNEQVFPLVERPPPPFGHKVSAIRYKTEAEIDAECLVVVICTVTFTSLAMIIVGTWMYSNHKRVQREIMNR
ncbi:hypothetical protein M3Y95_01202100 [Aphelenchoides besseyi]|nr:hypothetical protein M3Y95_01202100 [Aphelenchoides besseyi]